MGREEFHCGERTRDGTICAITCSTAWNLKRHKNAFHHGEQLTEVTLQTNRTIRPVEATPRIARLAAAPNPSHAIAPTVTTKTRQSGLEAFTSGHTLRASLPIYKVPQSSSTPGQQCAIDWLKASARSQFGLRYADILNSWGVKDSHWGTCVLVPAHWQALEPAKIAGHFDEKKRPKAFAESLQYSYKDYQTTLVRAKAWFKDWPRNGVELDNFLFCGPFAKMRVSHLCDKHNCLIHIAYEDIDVGLSREACYDRARLLRNTETPVPKLCNKHNPPCMMQHSALTTYESYLIQFYILRRAKNLEPIATPTRPHQHVYNTFEFQLPIQFTKDHSAFDMKIHDLSVGDDLLRSR